MERKTRRSTGGGRGVTSSGKARSNILTIRHQVVQVLAPDCAPLFLTDGFRKYELVASFVNRSHLLKSWEKTETCEGSLSRAHGPKNPVVPRIPVPRSATKAHAFFWPYRSRMTLLPYTWANVRSFCATENSQPVHTFLRSSGAEPG